ncbi:protocadherin [Lignipirellula cremea]|nr:protocadherin [Lignipirellula cremea]
MHNLGGGGANSSSVRSNAGGNGFDVNHGATQGPRGGYAAGGSVTGPQGNTAYRGGAVGANGGAVAGRGFDGAGGASGGQAVGRGPNGGVAAGGQVTGPGGNSAYRGGAVGPNGGAVAGRGFDGAGGASGGQAIGRGPDGGVAAGGRVTGPDGNSAYRGAAVGPNGGAVAGRGFDGAGGVSGGQAIGRGPGGTVAGGGAIRGPNGGAAGRGFVARPATAGFVHVAPSGRYNCAVAVRGGFNHWGVYGAGWYTAHPGAWYAAGWGAGAIWRTATWASVGSWMSYYPAAPLYYDYGSNVVIENNNVYVNNQDVGNTTEYYNQALSLATDGANATAPADGDWLPLGVFALTKPDQPKSDVTIQLAVSKQGVVRGNYTDNVTGVTQVVQGSVDKSTQRLAFTVGDNTTNVVETGIYNLTKDEAPVLIHLGQDKTEQWLLVRLKNPKESGN